MCRWLAYSGFPIHMSSLILKPENSLINQSHDARESLSVLNGDGFGVGWYDSRPEPGQVRDTLPAWNDSNLKNISEQVRSRLFFAHVRASTGTPTSRTNSHPFKHGKWLFMHNGQIGGFKALRWDISLLIAPELFSSLQGTTDSEAFFYLLLTNGLEKDPAHAFARSIEQVQEIMGAAGTDEPLTMTAAATDGEAIYAIRYASNGKPPTLYYSCGVALTDTFGTELDTGDNAVLILSEPLSQDQASWNEVPAYHLLIAGDGAVSTAPIG